LSKALTSVANVPNNRNAFDLTFAFVVTNPGDVDLSNVQVVDDLSTVFAAAQTTQVLSVTASGTLLANGAYDGVADKNLLAAGSTLVAGGSAGITLKVRVGVNATRSFVNSAVVTATTTVGGQPVTDTSQNGANPDPDNDGNPTNNNDPTPVNLPATPLLIEPTPALGTFAVMLLIGLLLMVGAARSRRRG
jgi:hypothetical protein